jgi:Fe-S-cluster containining protein
MAGFPCDRCGCCCIRKVMTPAKLAHLCGPDEQGTCVHYRPEQGCAIYATRPAVCRNDQVFHTHGFSEQMTWAVYVGVARALCHDLQRQAGWTPPVKPRSAEKVDPGPPT